MIAVNKSKRKLSFFNWVKQQSESLSHSFEHCVLGFCAFSVAEKCVVNMIAENIITGKNNQIGLYLVVGLVKHFKHCFSRNMHILGVAYLKDRKFSVFIKSKLFLIHYTNSII